MGVARSSIRYSCAPLAPGRPWKANLHDGSGPLRGSQSAVAAFRPRRTKLLCRRTPKSKFKIPNKFETCATKMIHTAEGSASYGFIVASEKPSGDWVSEFVWELKFGISNLCGIWGLGFESSRSTEAWGQQGRRSKRIDRPVHLLEETRGNQWIYCSQINVFVSLHVAGGFSKIGNHESGNSRSRATHHARTSYR